MANRPKDVASPLFDRRWEIQGALLLLSPLHIGDGEPEPIADVGGRVGANAEQPDVARAAVDCDGKPYLPPTTIKGILRRLAENSAKNDPLDVFGDIKGKDGSGAMGALLVRGGALITPGDTTGMPYVDAAKKAGGKLAPGTFVAARTAIDPLSGVAADAKLFFQEAVAPGARFGLRMTLIAGEDPPGEKRLDAVVALLSQFAAENGVACGRGKADGAGRLRLEPNSLRIVERSIDRNGNLVAKPVSRSFAPATRSTAVKRWSAIFHCSGPFTSLDSSWDPEKPTDKDAPNPPQLAYQQDANGAPLELGSQLAGVLRARARWLAGLEALRALPSGADDESIKNAVRDVDPTAGGDERAKQAARERVVVKRSDVARLALTPVERLFGVTGFAGLLRIETMRFTGGKPEEITSVKLDHFSGAPIDKALFTTRVMVGLRLEIGLALEERQDADAEKRTDIAIVTREDLALFDALIADIRDNGLTLGHGGNKGFGWFGFEE